MSLKQEIERVFGLWLFWSEDDEILALLDLIRATLKQRGYEVRCDVKRTNPNTQGGA